VPPPFVRRYRSRAGSGPLHVEGALPPGLGGAQTASVSIPWRWPRHRTHSEARPRGAGDERPGAGGLSGSSTAASRTSTRTIWWEFLLQRQDIVAGNTMIQILKARTDPRLAAYFDANAQGPIRWSRSEQRDRAGAPAAPPYPRPRLRCRHVRHRSSTPLSVVKPRSGSRW